MADKISFDPKALRRLELPFSIMHESHLKGKVLYRQVSFTKENIYHCFAQYITKQQFEILCLFSEEEIINKRTTLKTNHSRLKLSIDLKTYLKKHLSSYFYKSFIKVIPILNILETQHKKFTPERRYIQLPCHFFNQEFPELKFKLSGQRETLQLHSSFRLEKNDFDKTEIKRFQFLIREGNNFYLLHQKDWQLLEELEFVEYFSEQDFEDLYYPKLKAYELDISAVFEEEIREIIPGSVIQISELNGNLLLFLPRWDYDGIIVEDQGNSFELFENSKKVIYKRNKEIEQETLDFLENAHPNFKDQKSYFLTFAQASKKNWFYNFYYNKLKGNYRVTGMDMLSYFRYSDDPIQSEFQIKKVSESELTAHFETFCGEEKIQTSALQKALRENKKFILLKDNSLGVLSEEWLADYELILLNSTIENDEITFAKWVLLVAEKTAFHRKNLKIALPNKWLERWEEWNKEETLLYDKPQSVHAELRNYQQKGFEWLALMAEINAGTLLADDMGLGKTLQTLSALKYWQEKQDNPRFLVVAPASLIYNWKTEIEKFTPDLQLYIYHGADRSFEGFIKSKKSIMITSYALIRNDIEVFNKMIWDAIILDESHHIKNYQAQQTQAVLQLNGKRRILLNGTPIMNDISDLFPQLKFLLPQWFSSLRQFKNSYLKTGKKRKNSEALEELQKITNPFILRRTKKTAAPDLPDKTESVFWCEMAEDQRDAYDIIKQQVKNNIFVDIKNRGLNKAKLGVLQGITKLRQVCSSPQLLKDEDTFQGRSSVKIDNLIDELTSNLKDEKVLIFSQFIDTMELLKTAFDENKITYRSFSGKTPVEERMQRVNEFQQKESGIQVFLASLMAGNSGINLTEANYVFLVEPWWNKAVQQQAIDRTHRIGQTQKVFAYNMICKDSIEEKIMTIQNRKQTLSDEIISDDAGFVKSLSEEDIAFLFE